MVGEHWDITRSSDILFLPFRVDIKYILSAETELVALCATGIFFFFACPMAIDSILWDIVPVNSTRRSGLPKFCIPLSGFANTFALHEYSRQRSSYRLTIHSLPPTITTLIIQLLLVSGC